MDRKEVARRAAEVRWQSERETARRAQRLAEHIIRLRRSAPLTAEQVAWLRGLLD